jgi:DeoR family fructose operon transcriptional repressor
MTRTERLRKIKEILCEKGNASFRYLAGVLESSEATVRRDASFMISSGDYPFVKRALGGIILLNHKMGLEFMFDLKLNMNNELKMAIARKAAECVEDGDSIIVDSGTTCLYAARELHVRTALRALVTDVKIAEELGRYSSIETIIAGGVVRPGYFTIGGEIALEVMEKFNVEKTLLSADAIDVGRGITNASLFEAAVKRKAIACARKTILLADSTKFGQVAMYRVADLDAVQVIITNKDLDPGIAESITKKGVELILV